MSKTKTSKVRRVNIENDMISVPQDLALKSSSPLPSDSLPTEEEKIIAEFKNHPALKFANDAIVLQAIRSGTGGYTGKENLTEFLIRSLQTIRLSELDRVVQIVEGMKIKDGECWGRDKRKVIGSNSTLDNLLTSLKEKK